MSDFPNDIQLTAEERVGLCFVGVREAGLAVVYVYENGRNTGHLEASVFAQTKSPTGFEWGYDGSGPSALAHSIIVRCTADEVAADQLWMTFRERVVSLFPEEGFRLSETSLRQLLGIG